LNTQVNSDDILPPAQFQINAQKLPDPIQQNIIREDILYVHKETILPTQSHQQEETLNLLKPLTDLNPHSSNQQLNFNTTINDTLQNNSSLDVKPSSTTPLQSNQPQQPISDPVRTVDSLDPKLAQQQPISDSVRNVGSLDPKLVQQQQQQQQPISDSVRNVDSFDPKLVQQQQQQQQPISDSVRNVDSLDSKLVQQQQQQQPISDSVRNVDSLDSKLVQQQQQHQTLSDPVENVGSLDPKLAHQQQQPISDSVRNVGSSDPKPVQQQPTSDSVRNVGSLDSKSIQQQQPTPDPIQNFGSVDSKPVQQQQTLDTIKSDHSLDLKSREQQLPDPMQNVGSLDPKTIQQQTSETIKSDHSLDLQSEQEQFSDKIQNISSSDQNSSPPPAMKSDSIQNFGSSNQQKQIPETIQNTTTTDHHIPSIEIDQQPPVFSTVRPTETVPIDTKSNDRSSVQKESPTIVQTASPPTRVLRSATSRIQQKAQERHRHLHSHQEPVKTEQEPENITATTGKINLLLFNSLIFLLLENATTIETTLPSTIMPTIEQPVEAHNHSIETSLPPSSFIKPEEPLVETAQKPSIDLDADNITEVEIDDQNLEPLDTIDLPRQVHVHDSNTILNELKDESTKNENQLLDEEIENNATVASFLVNDHSPHLPRILENEETAPTLDSTIETMINPSPIIDNNDELNQNLIQNESKVNPIE
jgi:hypothetical protein